LICDATTDLNAESVIDQKIDGVWPEGGRVNAPGEMIPMRLNASGTFLDVYAFPKGFASKLCQWNLMQKLRNEAVIDAMIQNRRLEEVLFGRVMDFLRGKIDNLKGKFQMLKKSILGQPSMAKLYVKSLIGQATPAEREKAQEALKDMLKAAGLGLLWMVPFAGTGLLISVALVGKEVGVDPFPTAEYLGMEETVPVDNLIYRDKEEEHVELDPDFFDETNHLLPDVREVLLLVVADVLANLKEKNFGFQPLFTVLTGSLCGPNWDKDSDVDLHVGVDFSQVAHEAELFKTYLGLYARQFNLRGYDLAGRDLELYFQDVAEEHRAPGVYDLVADAWIQVPTGVKIDITDEMKKAAAAYLKKIEEFEAEFKEQDPYGSEAKLFLDKVRAFWQGVGMLRKMGLEAGGRASFGNQVFKQLRRNKGLEKVTNLLRDVQDRVYEVVRSGD